MDTQEIKRIGSLAKMYTRKFGYPQEQEDISQSVLLYYLENPKSCRNVRWVTMDCLSKYIGDRRNEPGRLKIAQRGKKTLNYEIANEIELSRITSKGEDHFWEYLWPLLNMNKETKKMITEYFFEGRHLQEIATEKNRSLSRMSTRLHEALNEHLLPTLT
jgi:hypothetical protein